MWISIDEGDLVDVETLREAWDFGLDIDEYLIDRE
jgi:hypothetical protein